MLSCNIGQDCDIKTAMVAMQLVYLCAVDPASALYNSEDLPSFAHCGILSLSQ